MRRLILNVWIIFGNIKYVNYKQVEKKNCKHDQIRFINGS